MQAPLDADILTASQPLQVPGVGERRVLSPVAVGRLAAASQWPRWKVEAQALEMDVVPLHYLRNLSQFGTEGQVRLLRSSVTVMGGGAALSRALELLALNGVGRFTVLAAAGTPEGTPQAEKKAEELARAARNRNASSDTQTGTVLLRGGNPTEAVRGADGVAACLDNAMDEQLLQFACRIARVPLILAGVEETRGQITTVLPGDPGVALVYKPSHPHLEAERSRTAVEPKAGLMVGAWIAEQVTRVLLGNGELLRGRLLYADLDAGEMGEYPL